VSKLHGVNASSIKDELQDLNVIGFLPYKVEAVYADLQGGTIFDLCPDLVEEAAAILDRIDKSLTEADESSQV